MSDKTINITLKAGDGYNAPWITVGGDTEAEVAFKLKAVRDNLLSEATQAAKEFQGFWTATDSLGATPADPTAPWDKPGVVPPPAPQQPDPWATSAPAPQWAQPQQQAPQQPQGQQGAPLCAHGQRKLVNSKPGAARQWSAWMCPTPKGTPGQCEPEWVR